MVLVKTVGRFVSDLRHVVNKARKSVNENILGPSVNGLVKELEEDERFEDDLEAVFKDGYLNKLLQKEEESTVEIALNMRGIGWRL